MALETRNLGLGCQLWGDLPCIFQLCRPEACRSVSPRCHTASSARVFTQVKMPSLNLTLGPGGRGTPACPLAC